MERSLILRAGYGMILIAFSASTRSQDGRKGDLNLRGQPLQSCSTDSDPQKTGIDRSGSCKWDESDAGYHQVCVTMSDEFLNNSKNQDHNDLRSVVSAGGHWCICAWAFASAVQRGGNNLEGLKLDCDRTNLKLVDVYKHAMTSSGVLKSPSEKEYEVENALNYVLKTCGDAAKPAVAGNEESQVHNANGQSAPQADDAMEPDDAGDEQSQVPDMNGQPEPHASADTKKSNGAENGELQVANHFGQLGPQTDDAMDPEGAGNAELQVPKEIGQPELHASVDANQLDGAENEELHMSNVISQLEPHEDADGTKLAGTVNGLEADADAKEPDDTENGEVQVAKEISQPQTYAIVDANKPEDAENGELQVPREIGQLEPHADADAAKLDDVNGQPAPQANVAGVPPAHGSAVEVESAKE